MEIGRHSKVEIGEGRLRYERDDESIARESALDGIYVIRTTKPARRLTAEQKACSYKNLSLVERLFRGLTGIGFMVRPIRH